MKSNIAYIDNQNLYMATKTNYQPWQVDLKRLRVYLLDRYNCEKALLFMGAYEKNYAKRYDLFESFGYQLMFRMHDEIANSKKKGNVDTDVVFQMMHDFHHDAFEKAVLVSGDGDYFKTVDYLIKQNRFECLALPSHKNASSLYKRITHDYYIYLDDGSYRKKLGMR